MMTATGKPAWPVCNTLFDDPYLSTGEQHQGLILHSVYHRPNGWDAFPRGDACRCGVFDVGRLSCARGRVIPVALDREQAVPEVLALSALLLSPYHQPLQVQQVLRLILLLRPSRFRFELHPDKVSDLLVNAIPHVPGECLLEDSQWISASGARPFPFAGRRRTRKCPPEGRSPSAPCPPDLSSRPPPCLRITYELPCAVPAYLLYRPPSPPPLR